MLELISYVHEVHRIYRYLENVSNKKIGRNVHISLHNFDNAS